MYMGLSVYNVYKRECIYRYERICMNAYRYEDIKVWMYTRYIGLRVYAMYEWPTMAWTSTK